MGIRGHLRMRLPDRARGRGGGQVRFRGSRRGLGGWPGHGPGAGRGP